MAEAIGAAADHPAQAPPATLERKLAYVYVAFVPLFKRSSRRDAIAQQIAALSAWSEDATGS